MLNECLIIKITKVIVILERFYFQSLFIFTTKFNKKASLKRCNTKNVIFVKEEENGIYW